MTYSLGHSVRPIGGRLILDFLNTADWSSNGTVVHEKLETLEDAKVWMRALGLAELPLPGGAAELRGFRSALRPMFLGSADADAGLDQVNAALRGLAGDALVRAENNDFAYAHRMSLQQAIALSAVSVLAEPREAARIKRCPAEDCGWLFLDETKNARRKWCSMETCGNRAKARRSYERTKRKSA